MSITKFLKRINKKPTFFHRKQKGMSVGVDVRNDKKTGKFKEIMFKIKNMRF
jgi:hypothetical protein